MNSKEKSKKAKSKSQSKKKIEEPQVSKSESISEKVNDKCSEPKESSKSNNSESIQTPNDIINKKQLEQFMDKINQGSRGRKKIKKSISSDQDNLNQQSEEESSKEKDKNYSKEYQNEIEEIVNNLLMKMRSAEEQDLQSNSNLLPAYAKIELIDKEISQAIKNLQIQKLFLENEGLKILEKWIQKQPKQMEPSQSLKQKILEMVLNLALDKEQISNTKIGQSIMAIYNNSGFAYNFEEFEERAKNAKALKKKNSLLDSKPTPKSFDFYHIPKSNYTKKSDFKSSDKARQIYQSLIQMKKKN